MDFFSGLIGGFKVSQDILEKIRSQVESSEVLVYMKGTKDMPQCGFSAATVELLESLEVPFETVDVLSDPQIREGIKRFSNWPTIPQVYVKGKFIGGIDIVQEMHEKGELLPLLQEALQK
jgi:monothiol glutaredoxin